jgi:hypothetical protein
MNYCERHGCNFTTRDGHESNICVNCGTPKREVVAIIGKGDDPDPEGAALVPTDTVGEFQGDGKPGTKPSNPINPKDAIGQGKLPMHLVPTAVTRYAALAFAEGALKYGKYNWRVAGVRMSIYLDALHRHLAKLQDGEWADGDSMEPDAEGNPQGTQVPHLANIIACAGIILDAWECAKLTDDRPPVNGVASENTDLGQKHIAHLKALFASYTPHQHTIADARSSEPK